MKVKGIAAVAAFALCLFVMAALAVRVARHATGARIELGALKVVDVEEATRARLAALDDKVFLTYFVSPRDEMPSHMRGIERDVETLFRSLRAAAPDRLDYAIVRLASTGAREAGAPAETGEGDGPAPVDDDLERYAANRRISPVRVRSVDRDAYSERTVWSGISIAYKTYRPAVVNGIEPMHLTRLQAIVMAHLDRMERPRRPIVALAVPSQGTALSNVHATYTKLAAELRKCVEVVDPRDASAIPGKVLTVDLNGGAPIPKEADVLFWIDPTTPSPSRLRELQLYLESGRCAVIAGSEWVAEVSSDASGTPQVEFKSTGYDAQPLLSAFGLAPVRGLVLDGDCLDLVAGQNKIPAPFVFRCIAYRQDFRRMRGQPNGTLLFPAPTPMRIDAERVAELGFEADVLATSSDKTWIAELPSGPVPVMRLTPEEGESVPMQPLIVGLRSKDPWGGRLVLCSAGGTFHDGNFDRDATAHWRLLRVLTDTLASDEQIVYAQLGARRPAPVPELERPQRWLWRFLCVFVLPILLGGVAWRRGVFGEWASGLRTGARPGARRLPLAVLAGGALAAVVLLSAVARGAGVKVDWTRDRIRRLSTESTVIARAAQNASIRAEVYFSAQDRLPAVLRPHVADLVAKLREIRAAGADLTVVRTEPEDLAVSERRRLGEWGIVPVKVTSREEELTVVRNVYASVRLVRGDSSSVLHFSEPRDFESLEFRLVFAIWKLLTGISPHVVVVNDSPRMSPAEAHDMQQAGLSPPTGNDVYSVARETLRDLGYRVTHVNPRLPKPVLPADADVVVWFQPRRDCCPMMEELVRYLHGGGRVALFAQHFVMQSRQYPGSKFEFVYWPQPQFPDIDEVYYPDIGILATREVLFDDLRVRMELDAQVHRGGQKDLKPMESALPFAIRASASNAAADSYLTRNLGDQAFLFASFLEWDEARLRELGLTATPLWTTSERSWTLAWKGGWIPNSFLVWPPSPFEAPGKPPVVPRRFPRAALAALFEGTFPLPAEPLTFRPPQPAEGGAEPESRPRPRHDPANPGKPAKLYFVGCSEAFKNTRIADREFRADQFLANTAAALVFDREAFGVSGGRGLASVASQRPAARGFGPLEDGAKLSWRIAVQAAAPVLFLAAGLMWLWRRRAAPPLVP